MPMVHRPRERFLSAWQEAAAALVAVTSIVNEFPVEQRLVLLNYLDDLKTSQIRRYKQVEELSPAASTVLEGCIAEQQYLVAEIANFLVRAVSGAQPASEPNSASKLRGFAGEFHAVFRHLDGRAREAVSATASRNLVP